MNDVRTPESKNLVSLVARLAATPAVALIWIIATFFAQVGHAQTAAGFTVEVVVADPGASQRSSAYWLALDKVLRQNIPEGTLDDQIRAEIFNDPSRYVQTYRYRKYDPRADGARMATRKVREGASADSVIAVTFPASLVSVIQQQNQPIEFVEETVAPVIADILAVIAVQQDGQQFLIGGERGRKFQARLVQIGAANNFTFKFPSLDSEDMEIISPANVLYNEIGPLELITQKYNTTSRLTAVMVRLSADAWQSDWSLVQAGQAPRSVNLTTRTLDEALITAMGELTRSDNQSMMGTAYLTEGAGFQRSGVAVRVENINSLAQYEQALAALQTIDPTIITEALEPGATVFRAVNLDALTLQQKLAGQTGFYPLPGNEVDAELNYQFQSR